MKKTTSTVFLLFFFLTVFPFTPTSWTLGTGIPSDPFLISTPNQLAYLAQQTNLGVDYTGVNFQVTTSLNLANDEWIPIGTKEHPFKGEIDGNHYEISGLRISVGNNYQGLLGAAQGATMKHFVIKSGSVVGDSIVGSLLGYADNSIIEGCFNAASVTGKKTVGGLVGQLFNNSTLTKSMNIGSVSAGNYDRFAGGNEVGGLVGYVLDSDINSCANFGSVVADNSFQYLVGGLVGLIENSSTLSHAYNVGTVLGSAKKGAIAGAFQQETTGTTTVTSCYYDKQLLPHLTCFGYMHTAALGHLAVTDTLGKFTTDLVALSPSGAAWDQFAAVDDDLYPTFAYTNDIIKLAVSPIAFGVNETIDSIRNGFTASTTHGATWTSDNVHVSFVGTNGFISTMCEGAEPVVFSASLNGVTKTLMAVLKNTYPKYLQAANLSAAINVCAYELPKILGDKTIGVSDFDANGLFEDWITFQTGAGCDSMVYVTATLRNAPSMSKLTADHHVIGANTTPIQFQLSGIPPFDYVLNYNGTQIAVHTNNPIVTFSVDAGNYYLESLTDKYCSAETSGLSDTIRIGVQSSVVVTIDPVSNGTVVDVTPTVVADGINVKSFFIQPAAGYYLSSLQCGLMDVYNQVVVAPSADGLLYSYIPTSDANLIAQFSPISTWGGATSMPKANVVGDTLLIYTAEELAWLATQTNNGTETFLGKHIILMNDLNLGGVYNPLTTDWSGQTWLSIGSILSATQFKGDFNGNGHEIANLLIEGANADYLGLFGVIGSQAVVKNLAIVSGSISGRNQIGALVGYNLGHIHHCYNMSSIEKGGEHVGALVGRNDGTIKFVYNVGIVYKSQNVAGGIVGYNAGIIDSVYCAGDVSSYGDILGAIAGQNSTTGSIAHSYFDYQMCTAVGVGKNQGTAVTVARKTAQMYTFFSTDLVNWVSLPNLYPQLKGLDLTDAAFASVTPILLKDGPLSSDVEDVSRVTSNFTVNTTHGSSWTSSNKEWVSVAGSNATVTLKCESSKEIYLTDSVNDAYKIVRILLPKLSLFDPGSIVTTVDTVCSGDANHRVGNNVLPSGGDGFYEYMWIQINANDLSDRDTIYNLDAAYLPTTSLPGTYNFERWVKDNTCQLVYAQSDGIWTLHILNPFMVGEISVIGDTVCGVETPLEIGSLTDASGGDVDQIEYRWLQNNVVVAGASAATYLPTETTAGEYLFSREVRDNRCEDWTKSLGTYRLVIYPVFDPGEIESLLDTVCANETPQTIRNLKAASDGYQTSYIWTCNDTIIVGATDSLFTPPSNLPAGTYVYKRFVTNNYCQAGDTIESAGVSKLLVYSHFYAGEVTVMDTVLCVTDVIPEFTEILPAQGGDNQIQYRWLMDGVEIASTNLSSFTPDDSLLSDNNVHVFTRESKDNHCSAWIAAVGSVTLQVLKEFTPGQIMAMNDTLCYTSSDGFYDMILGSVTSASGGDDQITYRWLMQCHWRKYVVDNSGDTPISSFVDTVSYDTLRLAHAADIYHFVYGNVANARLPMTFVFVRQAKDELCNTVWETSVDTIKYVLAPNSKTSRKIYICQNDFPYTYTYTYTDRHTENVVFTEDGQTFVMDDHTNFGCDYKVTLMAVLCASPEVSVEPLLPVCETETEMTFAYQIEAGTPDQYKLTFNQAAQNQGFSNVAYTNLPVLGNTISFPIPSTAQPGIYQVTVQFIDTRSAAGCTSVEYVLDLYLALDGYVRTKWTDVIFVDNNPTTHDSLKFVAYQWYRDGALLDGATEQFYVENGGLDGVYYVMLEDINGLHYRSCDFVCVLQPSNTINIKVYPVPAKTYSTLVVELPFTREILESGVLEVFNTLGTKVYETRILNPQTELVSMSMPGIYLVRFTTATGQVYSAKFIVE